MDKLKLERIKRAVAFGFIFSLIWVFGTMIFAEVAMKKTCVCWDKYNNRYILSKYSFEELICSNECNEFDLSTSPTDTPAKLGFWYPDFNISITK